MFSHRNAHYWLWFLIFGVVAGLLNYKANGTLGSEAIWLLISGLIGIIVGGRWLNEGKLAKPYDLIIGIIFALVGILGILLNFGLFNLSKAGLPSGVLSNGSLIGLSLATFPALVHTVLGLTSINHGFKAK